MASPAAATTRRRQNEPNAPSEVTYTLHTDDPLPYLDPEDAEPHTAAVLRKSPDLGIFRMVANAQGAFPRLDALRLDAVRRR